MTFQLPLSIRMMAGRERIMAKRELYGKARSEPVAYGNVDLSDANLRKWYGLPHQGAKECARRVANGQVPR